MRKTKIGFSLLVMAIISMMSVVVFAATTPIAPAKQVINVKAEALSTTRAALFFAKDPTDVINSTLNTSYDHYTVKVTTDAVPVERTVVNGGIISFENALLTGTKQIDIEIRAYGDSGSSLVGPVATYSFNVDADALASERHNSDMDKDSAALEDNNLRNANQTGLGELNKAVSGHAVHGDYKNNTNSCASCHQTHTAAASKLLFKKSDYAACVTCHNGTLGYFNVFETDNTKDLGGGTFGGTKAMGNMSVHMVDGSVLIGAAPGANVDIAKGTWSSEFSCTACHDPHGSYSKRLLASDPNGMAFVDRTVTDGISYGNQINDLPIVDGSAWADKAARTTAITAWGSGDYKTALGAVKAAKFTVDATDVGTGGDYDTAKTGLHAGDKIVQIYRWNDSLATPAWVAAPFMASGANSGDKIDFAIGTEATATNDFNGVSFDTTKYGAWKTKVSNSKAAALPGWFVNQTKGFVRISQSYTPASVNTAYNTGAKTGGWLADGSINPALVVDKDAATVFSTITYVTNLALMQVTDLPQVDTGLLTAAGTHIYKTDLVNLVGKNPANGYNQFCATCHIDYLGANKYNAATATTPESGVGTGTQKFFHHAMSNNYTCARCHFAHGTDATWMKDAAGRDHNDLVTSGQFADDASAVAYLKDVNNSSALKRYTNMSVCYGCHTSSHSEVIVNSGTFGTSADQVNGLNVDGSASYLFNNYDVTKTVGVQ